MKSLNKKENSLKKHTYEINRHEIGYVFYGNIYIMITLWIVFAE